MFALPQSPSSIGNTLTQPIVPTPSVPTDPSQVSLWQNFQNRLKQDPNLRMALLTTGLNMMKSQQPGQTGFDTFTNAALTGIGTYDQLKQRDNAARIEEEKLDLSRRNVANTERRTENQEEQFEQSFGLSKSEAERRKSNDARRAEEFNSQYNLAKEKFEEQKRQFNESLTAQGTAAGSMTGAERMLAADIEMLQTLHPDIYTRDAEGEAKAREILRMKKTSDPNAQARIISGLMDTFSESNFSRKKDEQLSNERILEEAIETYKLISQDLTSPEDSDTLDGAFLSHPSTGEKGIIRKIGEDQYVVEYKAGATAALSAEQVKAIQKSGAVNVGP